MLAKALKACKGKANLKETELERLQSRMHKFIGHNFVRAGSGLGLTRDLAHGLGLGFWGAQPIRGTNSLAHGLPGLEKIGPGLEKLAQPSPKFCVCNLRFLDIFV